MDRIRITMNPVNCLFHLPSLSFTLHGFYLWIWIFCLKCLSPCLDINPKMFSFSQLKSVLALWASGVMSKYWCLLPLKMPPGKKVPLGSESEPSNLVFLPSFLHFLLQNYTNVHTHTQEDTHLMHPPASLWHVWLSEAELSLHADTRQSSGGKFISEAIAHRASHLCLALGPSVGQDLPSMIGSFFIPKHSSSFPHNPTGFKWNE